MLSYYLKTSQREEGPYSEAQVAQFFAESRIDRHTPCRTSSGGSWKTIDDCLPMLKYEAQSAPAPSLATASPAMPPPLSLAPPALSPTSAAVGRNVALVDIDLPFGSLLKLMFKWMAAAFLVFCCFLPALVLLLFVLTAIFGSFLGHLFSSSARP